MLNPLPLLCYRNIFVTYINILTNKLIRYALKQLKSLGISLPFPPDEKRQLGWPKLFTLASFDLIGTAFVDFLAGSWASNQTNTAYDERLSDCVWSLAVCADCFENFTDGAGAAKTVDQPPFRIQETLWLMTWLSGNNHNCRSSLNGLLLILWCPLQDRIEKTLCIISLAGSWGIKCFHF